MSLSDIYQIMKTNSVHNIGAETECIASGTYTGSIDGVSTVLPLVAVGTYANSIWTYPTTVTNTGFVGGAFTSAAMSSS